jgi:hypothetical protein
MSEQTYIDFDLEVALKQPERVAQRGTEKPVEWKYFEQAKNIVYFDDEGNGIKVNLGGVNFGLYAYDLILLPEPKPFEPIEGKWYWVKVGGETSFPMVGQYANGGYYLNRSYPVMPYDLYSIHPDPIEPPTEGFINLKNQSK